MQHELAMPAQTNKQRQKERLLAQRRGMETFHGAIVGKFIINYRKKKSCCKYFFFLTNEGQFLALGSSRKAELCPSRSTILHLQFPSLRWGAPMCVSLSLFFYSHHPPSPVLIVVVSLLLVFNIRFKCVCVCFFIFLFLF